MDEPADKHQGKAVDGAIPKSIRAAPSDIQAFERLCAETPTQRDAFRLVMQAYASSDTRSAFQKEMGEYKQLLSKAHDILVGVAATADLKIQEANQTLAKELEALGKKEKGWEERDEARKVELEAKDLLLKTALEEANKAKEELAAAEKRASQLEGRAAEQADTITSLRQDLNDVKARGQALEVAVEKLRTDLVECQEQSALQVKTERVAHEEMTARLKAEFAERQEQAVRLAQAECQAGYEQKLRELQEKIADLRQGMHEISSGK